MSGGGAGPQAVVEEDAADKRKAQWELTPLEEAQQKVKDLEYKVKNAKAIKDKQLKTAEEQVKKCKKAAEESKARWSAKEQEEGSLRLELDELKKSISNAEEQFSLVAQTITSWESQISEQKVEV